MNPISAWTGSKIHANFTAKVTVVRAIDLDHNLDGLRKIFTDPRVLEPGELTEAITQGRSRAALRRSIRTSAGSPNYPLDRSL